MSKKSLRSRKPRRDQILLPGDPSLNMMNGTQMAFDRATKTYLNQEVALLRPQVAHAEMAHLYRMAVTARAAVDLRAESLRQVDFKIADGDGNLLEKSPKLFTPVAKAIQFAFSNNFQSIIERIEVSYCFYGQALLRRLWDKENRLIGFQWINNNFYRLETDPAYGLRGFHIRPVWGSDLEPDFDWLAPEDSVYIHNIDFFEDFGGTGPVMVAYAQAATETEISATQLMFFRNMAMPSFVIQPAQGEGYVPGIDQKDTLTEYLRRMYQGASNMGRTAVLPTRWELLKFQQDFDKLGMPQLTQEARDAVLRILRVPVELLEPRQATRSQGTRFYDQMRQWLVTWLVPQAERYANVFTEQIAKPLNSDWTIVPDYKRVRGLDEDISSRTETVQKQISSVVIDLATAQQQLGLEVDPNLKGVYLVNGIPLPSDQFATYHQYAPGNPGVVSGGELTKMDKPPKTQEEKPPKPPKTNAPKTPNSAGKPGKKAEDEEDVEGPRTITFLPDAQHKEIKAWKFVVERKGVGYDFVAKALPSHAVAYGKFLLVTGGANEDVWTAIRAQATKTYPDTESLYRTALYDLMTDAFQGNLDRMQFGQAGRSEISNAFMSAFKNGLQDSGVDPSEITVEEKTALDDETKQERGFWTHLSNQMYREVMPLKGQDGFVAARDRMLGRIEQWVNKGLDKVHILGQMYGKMNGMKKFVLGGAKDHCATCSAADGQVHRQRTWLKYGIYPRSDLCICTGINCQCSFEDTDEPANGSLASVPVAGGKHDHSSTEVDKIEREEAVV